MIRWDNVIGTYFVSCKYEVCYCSGNIILCLSWEVFSVLPLIRSWFRCWTIWVLLWALRLCNLGKITSWFSSSEKKRYNSPLKLFHTYSFEVPNSIYFGERAISKIIILIPIASGSQLCKSHWYRFIYVLGTLRIKWDMIEVKKESTLLWYLNIYLSLKIIFMAPMILC